MTIKQIMERVGITETGRALAYIKDGLEEINLVSETHFKKSRHDITRVKNHLNSKDEYRSIPRLIYKPLIKDADES